MSVLLANQRRNVLPEIKENMSDSKVNLIGTNQQLLKDTADRTAKVRHNKETIESLNDHVVSLVALSTDEKFTQTEKVAYAAKAAAIKKIVDEQSERIMALTSREQAFNLADLIRATATYDNADAAGTIFALSYVLDFYDA